MVKKELSTNEYMKNIREKSGSINSTNRLVNFLYILMRDNIAPGVVESILLNMEGEQEWQFCNGWLAEHAKYIAEKLESRSDDVVQQLLEVCYNYHNKIYDTNKKGYPDINDWNNVIFDTVKQINDILKLNT